MSLSADDEFLNTIAYQARVAYATQQLAACRDALQRRQVGGASEAGASDGVPLQQELAHYTQQLERWQDYLGHLGAGPNGLSASEMPAF
jgi:hypothetical protein